MALKNILKNVKRNFPDIKAHDKIDKLKLFFQREQSSNIVKIEVNFVMRQSLGTPSLRILCQKARDMFQKSCEMMVLPVDQMYGSKMVATLDRQHPRDLFDIQFILRCPITEGIKKGFMFQLLNSKRGFHELICPSYKSKSMIKDIMLTKFNGMANSPFTYQDYMDTRDMLVRTVHENLNEQDKIFLIEFMKGNPRWDIYDFRGHPSTERRLMRLENLRKNPVKFKVQLEKIEKVFE